MLFRELTGDDADQQLHLEFGAERQQQDLFGQRLVQRAAR
jgi:hypothetical protein